MTLRQVAPSLSFRGAQMRQERRRKVAVNEAILAASDPEADYWYDMGQRESARLVSLLPDYIAPLYVRDCLMTWFEQSNAMTIAKGYKAGADYLEACKHTAADVDVLLSRIRGRWWHNATVDWKDDPKHWGGREEG